MFSFCLYFIYIKLIDILVSLIGHWKVRVGDPCRTVGTGWTQVGALLYLYFLPGSWAVWGGAARVNQRGTEWVLSPQKNGRAGQRCVCVVELQTWTKGINPCLSFSCQTSNLYFYCSPKRTSHITGVHSSVCPFCFHRSKAREYLISIDPGNETRLELIQSSLFIISLDETKPYSSPDNYTNVWADGGSAPQAAGSHVWPRSSAPQLTQESLKGDPTVRWGDKSYNLIVYSDGTFGSNCDVSWDFFLLHLTRVQHTRSAR